VANDARRFEGWLFDAYPRGGEMVVWFLTPDGEAIRAAEEYRMAFYLSGDAEEVARCAAKLAESGDAEPLGWTERNDIWTGGPRPVFAMRTLRIETWKRALMKHAKEFPELSWYNADLLPAQVWFYERGAFPLAWCAAEARDGRLVSLDVRDDLWARECPAPPMRMVRLEGAGTFDPRRPRLRSLTLRHEDRSWTWEEEDGILSGLQRAVDDIDPDVVLTRNGDGFLLPLLFACAARTGFPLRLDRDVPPEGRRVEAQGRSYFSYGQVLYQEPDWELFGRWHLDGGNSFVVSHTGLQGLLESARVGRYPVQRGARRSIGTGITSVQLAEAWRRGVLVPWKKSEPEAWKTANVLIKTDRGGLVYAPRPGFFENVVELDFAAMYPSIMAKYNVSPETVNCPCCDNPVVPELGYSICGRRGLVSEALAPIVARRQAFKALRAEAEAARDAERRLAFDQRQDALKWMLVCCFGYLGYRNARFGRIEAHEAVSAYAREMLTRAKEVCVRRDWEMLHANVDCVWIRKPRWEAAEVGDLVAEIDEATRLTIALEGVYKWLGFLPSRQVKNRPVPTRYFGAFRTGKLKYRGIECRRGDTPDFVRDAQLELLNMLARTDDAEAYRRTALDLRARIDELEGMLWRHEVPAESLAIETTLSRDPGEYRGNNFSAIAARQAEKAGLKLHAGQSIRYVVADGRGRDVERRVRLCALMEPDTTCDPAAYIRLLRRAMNTLLWPTGVQLDEERIAAPWKKTEAKRPRPRDPQLDFLAQAS